MVGGIEKWRRDNAPNAQESPTQPEGQGIEDRGLWIDAPHPRWTIQQQCALLGLPRSTYYYQPRPESAQNLRLMRRLDELYLECPFFGSRRMAVTLGGEPQTHPARLMGIFFSAPPALSRPDLIA